jgi:hypothetical protein
MFPLRLEELNNLLADVKCRKPSSFNSMDVQMESDTLISSRGCEDMSGMFKLDAVARQ